MSADPRRVKELFVAALDLPDAVARRAWLDQECGGNTDLRRRLELLMAAHDRPDAALEQPLAAPPAAGAFTGSFAPGGGSADRTPDEAVGTVVAGRYKLLEVIGEGGMGAVWMAEQREPVKRLVALKLIKPGMDSRSVLARFEAERQALALMDHPNIAKVLDGGTTAEGRPYFVMELVKGLPLTEYCDARRLSVRDRLGLFAQVCQAVQHAHQKGIIHRDIKPSNVLVTEHDGRPVPKVIDFGLAKALTAAGTLTEKTLHTAFGSVVGTPLYMAPEQVGINALDVDTRTDIYALGVILYELLTGTTPLEKRRLREAAWDEMRRLIREEEPPRPSARLSTSVSLPSLAANRQIEPKRLTGLVRGELDWIVMKALEKDRNRRYETANGLALDVQRHLAGEPVQAVPPSAGYRLRKFARKNRAALTTAAVVAFLLLAGTVGTTFGLIRATRAAEAERLAKVNAEEQAGNAIRSAEREAVERQKSEAAKLEAQAKEGEANAMLRFFEDKVFSAARPKGQAGGLGKDVTLHDALEASLPALGQGFNAQPLVEARLRRTLGKTFSYLGESKKAAEQYQHARDLFIRHLGPDHPDTLKTMHNLAGSYLALKRHSEALKLHQETLAGMKRVLPPEDPLTLGSMSGLANCYYALNRHTEALQLREKTLAIQKRVLPPDHSDTLLSMNNLARSYAALKRHAEAQKLFEETLAIQNRVLPPDHPNTLQTMGNLANCYAALRRHTEALKLQEETLAIRKRVLPDHPETLISMTNLALRYSTLNRHAEAVKLNEEALAIQKRVLPPDHADTLRSMNNLATCYASLNRHAEALKLHEETLAIQKRVLPPDHHDTLVSMYNVAHTYTALKRHAKALELHEETLAAMKRVLQPNHSYTLNSMWRVAESLIKLDRGSEAIPIIDECFARAAGKLGPPKMIPSLMVLRMQHFQKTGEVAGCRATAVMWETLNRTDGNSLYDAACWRAVTSAVQTKTPGADASRLAKEDADKAMDWLHKAVAAGYKDANHMKKDTDLDFLRDREDFRKLLAELEKKFPPPPVLVPPREKK